MRLLLDSLIGVMVLAALAAGGWYWHHHQGEAETLAEARQSLRRLHDQVNYRKALATASKERGPAAFPRELKAEWFERPLPRNPLAERERPWLELAPAGSEARHPPDPVLREPGQAGLWYNPERGRFRARVPPQLTGEATLRLYNKVNGTRLDRLPGGNGTEFGSEDGQTYLLVRAEGHGRPRIRQLAAMRQKQQEDAARPALAQLKERVGSEEAETEQDAAGEKTAEAETLASGGPDREEGDENEAERPTLLEAEGQ
jgi:hypothetical protein